MKSFVVGAMLLHCMHAQVVPVVPSGINAPPESDSVLAPVDVTAPFPDISDVPAGAADVVLDEPTPVVPFGGASTPGTGISFGPEGVRILQADPVRANTFAFPSQPPALTDAASVAQPIAPSDTPADPVILADAANPAVITDPSPVDGVNAVAGTPVAFAAPPVDTSAVVDPIVSPSNTPIAANAVPVVAPVDTPIAANAVPVIAPVDTPIAANAVPVVAPVDTIASVDPTTVSPIAVPINAPVFEPPVAVGATPVLAGTTGLVDAVPVSATSSVISVSSTVPGGSAALAIGQNPYTGPYPPNSPYDPNSPYYDPTAQPPGWEGDDNGLYDGEDKDAYPGHHDDAYPGHEDDAYPGHDDEECPAWCMSKDDSYPTSTPDYDYSPYKPTPTPEYPGYETTAEPYPEYETTPAYTPYQTPSYAAEPYQQEPYQTSSPDYKAAPQYYPSPEPQYYPQLKKVRAVLHAVRRQVFNWPQSAVNSQPQYSDDDDSGEYDGEDGSIPDWLYDISGAPVKPTYSPKPKPKCPKSCYKPKSSSAGYATKPVKTYTYTRKGGYKTTESPYQTSEEPYYPEPTTDGYYGDKTTDAPYAGYTSSVYYPAGNSSAMYWPTGPTNVPDEPTSIPDGPTSVPDSSTSIPDSSTSIPDEPTSVPSESTMAPTEPTTLATYYQPAESYPEQTGGGWSGPGSPAGDYTGDTLDTICPGTCNPFNPAENFCDITTGCTTTGGSKYYCACRAGFRADGYNAKDFSKQFKVAGQPYVYLAVSTSCNTPCSDQTCSEVLERDQCK